MPSDKDLCITLQPSFHVSILKACVKTLPPHIFKPGEADVASDWLLVDQCYNEV